MSRARARSAASGLLTHATAGFVDPGFSGHVTLELSNVATLPIMLYPGMKIGQLCFFRLSSPAENPYGSAAYGSHYQGQRGPTASRSFKNSTGTGVSTTSGAARGGRPDDRGRMPFATLVWDAQPADAGAVVLVLHGGAVDGREPNLPWSHNVARLVPFARSLRKVPGPLAVARVRFRYRGWNGDEQAPLVDARWALEQVRAAYPDRPVAVVGHSMGGRVAIHVGDDPDVRLVVASRRGSSRPTRVPGRGVAPSSSTATATSSAGSRARAAVEQLQAQGRDATLIRVSRGDHGMLVRARLWTELVTGVTAGTFADELGIADDGGDGPDRGSSAWHRARLHGGGSVIDL